MNDSDFLKYETSKLRVKKELSSLCSLSERLSIAKEVSDLEKATHKINDGRLSTTLEVPSASASDTKNRPAQDPERIKKISLYRISEGVIIGVLVAFVLWCLVNYFGILI